MRPLVTLLLFLATLAVAWHSEAQQPDTDKLFASGVDAQQRGDYPAAIRDYEQLLRARPNLAEAHANLGAALAHTGRLDDAITQYKLALPNAADKDGVRLNLGLAYYKKGIAEIHQEKGPRDANVLLDLGEAIKQFQELRQRRPADPQLAILLGDSEVQSGKPSEAVAMLTPLEAANAANPDFEYVLGEAQIASGERRDGAARMAKLADATQGADAYLLAGTTYLDLNEIALARTNLEAALRLNPNFPHINTLVGIARDKGGDHDAAEPVFRKAIELDPNDFDANLYLGAILYKRRAVDEAKPYLDKALQLRPTDAMARYESAMWDSTSAKYEDAAKLLESVEKTDPDWLEPHVELATVYYRLHRPDEGAKERAIVDRLTAEQQSKGPGK
jgi:tetratricopeptide (TPR) repeat protein